MKAFVFGLLLIALLGLALPASALQGGGIAVDCTDGAQITNGVEVVVNQMRSGFSYTATAIGLGGFDPVLAVLDSSGRGLCNDDNSDAANYSASLPSTGFAAPSALSSQVTFTQSSGTPFDDVSLVVGGFSGQTGEFLLMLEGMAITPQDNAGDPFSVRVTPNMVASGIPLTAYMISVTDVLDPLMEMLDGNGNTAVDDSLMPVICDDAGNRDRCWGESFDLSGSFVSRTQGRQLGGFGFDSMLSIPLGDFALNVDPDFNFLTFLMSSFNGATFGDYFVAFHIGTGAAPGGGIAPQATAQTRPPAASQTAGGGVGVTCTSGASITNGVEIVVNQMRSGFTYSATAIGLGGFDPVLAVLDSAGRGLCTDDEPAAAMYSANLPTTGLITGSALNSRVTFTQNSGTPFDDVSLVVGGFSGQSGEFLLILEGMAITPEDNAGDPFAVRLTPNMVASGIPLTTYMISVTDALDPLLQLLEPNGNLVTDDSGAVVSCDDAGNPALCWGESLDLSGSFVSRTQGRQLGGFGFDAMLSLPLDGFVLNSNADLNFVNFLMTSFNNATFGDYVIAFHVGT